MTPTRPRPLRILVAEDEALIRLDLVEMLRDAGYDIVGEVGDGQAAVEQALALRPDLVFLDVAMPIRDGLSAATDIGHAGIAPVVMLTAFSQREVVERAARAGAMGYLVKPFTASDLVPAIEVALARWAQMTDLTSQIADLRQRSIARERIEAAKERLQRERGIDEAAAFAALRRSAMDQRVTLAEAASQVLAEP